MLELNPVRSRGKGVVYPFVLDVNEIARDWECLEPFIERSCRVSFGTVTPDAIKQMLMSGAAVCIGTAEDNVPKLVTVSAMVDYPGHRRARVIAMAGSGLKEAFRFFHVLETWAYMQGATSLEVFCRPAMVRMMRKFDFVPHFTMMTRNLKRNLQ